MTRNSTGYTLLLQQAHISQNTRNNRAAQLACISHTAALGTGGAWGLTSSATEGTASSVFVLSPALTKLFKLHFRVSRCAFASNLLHIPHGSSAFEAIPSSSRLRFFIISADNDVALF